uniref:Piezo non-specific cation channel R-Ras-binding domain-containing protein n=1 Tax=Chromera velia CCMP2878 TaxID=1169474 RepID=A0A0G4H4D9_9ALVE|eukprot:Cvel_24628.t1-p1 / transcript=Cvel_24628.t1 / gene=Cvel_24628 / organism=Chromera_velia_CCMP2878 / gene_product=hypothetical protein / transcript_product=hypothetical protein / location=Cvel_scaffold2687:231-1916(-) / protein_length=562 / sequence_SO=supercontig / SO=protein_coding / is_pseudo=false
MLHRLLSQIISPFTLILCAVFGQLSVISLVYFTLGICACFQRIVLRAGVISVFSIVLFCISTSIVVLKVGSTSFWVATGKFNAGDVEPHFLQVVGFGVPSDWSVSGVLQFVLPDVLVFVASLLVFLFRKLGVQNGPYRSRSAGFWRFTTMFLVSFCLAVNPCLLMIPYFIVFIFCLIGLAYGLPEWNIDAMYILVVWCGVCTVVQYLFTFSFLQNKLGSDLNSYSLLGLAPDPHFLLNTHSSDKSFFSCFGQLLLADYAANLALLVFMCQWLPPVYLPRDEIAAAMSTRPPYRKGSFLPESYSDGDGEGDEGVMEDEDLGSDEEEEEEDERGVLERGERRGGEHTPRDAETPDSQTERGVKFASNSRRGSRLLLQEEALHSAPPPPDLMAAEDSPRMAGRSRQRDTQEEDMSEGEEEELDAELEEDDLVEVGERRGRALRPVSFAARVRALTYKTGRLVLGVIEKAGPFLLNVGLFLWAILFPSLATFVLLGIALCRLLEDRLEQSRWLFGAIFPFGMILWAANFLYNISWPHFGGPLVGNASCLPDDYTLFEKVCEETARV